MVNYVLGAIMVGLLTEPPLSIIYFALALILLIGFTPTKDSST